MSMRPLDVETEMEEVSLGGETSPTFDDITRNASNDTQGTFNPTDNRSKSERLNSEFKNLRYIRAAQGKMTSPTAGILSIILYVAEIRNDLRFILGGGEHQHFVDHQKKCNRKPVVTLALMLVCIGAFVFTLQRNGWKLENPQNNFTFGPSFETLLEMGALSTRELIDDGEWWRFIVAPFLHSGIIHLIVNLVVMFFVGGAVEFSVGSVRTLVAFLAIAPAAFACTAVFSPFSATVGASGGICGWVGLGACTAMLQRSWFAGVAKYKVLCWVFVELILFLVIGLLPWFDNFAHVSGVCYGVLLGLCLIGQPSLHHGISFSTLYQHWKRLAIGLALFVGLVASCVLFLYNSDSIGDLPCRGCYRYVTCVIESLCDSCLVATAAVTEKLDGSQDVELYCPYGETNYFETMTQPFDPKTACQSTCAY